MKVHHSGRDQKTHCDWMGHYQTILPKPQGFRYGWTSTTHKEPRQNVAKPTIFQVPYFARSQLIINISFEAIGLLGKWKRKGLI